MTPPASATTPVATDVPEARSTRRATVESWAGAATEVIRFTSASWLRSASVVGTPDTHLAVGDRASRELSAVATTMATTRHGQDKARGHPTDGPLPARSPLG